uniref:Dynamin N-terminal domain-containing protein n=1 Tax=Tolypothrix bouteillei VB521301 TaxID=1479485 RepID=A0A0C1NGN0_9CYAN
MPVFKKQDSQHTPDTHTGISVKPFKFDGNHTVCNVFGWFFDNSMLMSFLGAGSTFFTVVSILRAKNPAPVQVVAAIIFTVFFLLFLVIEFWKWKKSSQPKASSFASTRSKHDLPGVITPLHKLCESLLNIVTKNAAIIQRPNSEEDAHNLLQDVRDGVLRIYIFGHQSAGKSTLINALLNSQVSPISSGKMTTCLIPDFSPSLKK